MFKGKLFLQAAIALGVMASVVCASPASATTSSSTQVGTDRPPVVSEDARQMLNWILASRDNQAMPFAVMDKKSARFFVFDGTGRLIGDAAALIGAAAGDHAAPGVGSRPLSQMKPEERTTPAGRFTSEPGHNLAGEDIVWVDYEAAFAIHRIRPGASEAQRQALLASPRAADHRVSLGCIVLDPAFYDQVVQPTLGQRRGVVYVLPETQTARSRFAALG